MLELRSSGALRVRRGAGFIFFIACVLLAAAGAAVLDDYGVSTDEGTQHGIAQINWGYIAAEAELRGFSPVHDRYYGVAFELPVLLAGKALGLDEARHVHLLRHAASHLLFLAGALCCALLARRMTGSTLAALLALALFALQPRIYAHAFFNSKDVPALALFAICLYLAHRALRRGGAGAFLLCGAGVAVATNLRLSAGLVLLAAVAGLRVLDLVLASGAAERRRVLAASGAFAAGWAGVLYAISPYMWVDGPAAIVDAAATLARHPSVALPVLFQGWAFSSTDLPAHYFPVWFSVSTPPALLALGLAGFGLALRRGLGRPNAALRNTPARFALLAAACWAGPPLAAALAGAHAYSGWRHMYFIHAPFCVLAAIGAAATARAATRMARRGKTALRALAGAGVVAAAASTVLLHPHQQVYFNGLEDRTTPWRIRERYDFGYWGAAFRAGLERALAERPGASVRVCIPADGHPERNRTILRPGDRARIALVEYRDGCDIALSSPRHPPQEGPPEARPTVPAAWSPAAYGSSFLDMFDMDAVRAARRPMWDSAVSRPPDIAAWFDVRIHDGMAIYTRDGCAPEDLAARFFLHVEPMDLADLPEDRRRYGFDNRDFTPIPGALAWSRPSAMYIGGNCPVLAPLPDYPIRRLRTGQIVFDERDGWRSLWEVEIDLADAPAPSPGG